MKFKIKPFVAAALVLSMLFAVPTAPAGNAEELTDEQIIWYYLKDEGLTDCGAAGLMGNLFAESGLKPTNLQNSFETKLGYTDSEYTNAVDSGSYSAYSFAHDSAGYGLAQWTYWSRKEGLYNYAKSQGASIGDLEMQLGYLVQELRGSYSSVWSTLTSATTVREASNKVLFDFEQPANQSTAVQNERTDYGFTYYNKYAGTERPAESSVEASATPEIHFGDVNGDGSITSSDAIAVQTSITGATTLTAEQCAAADVTKDGMVSSSDFMAITIYLTQGTLF